jgi:hypothetical protein
MASVQNICWPAPRAPCALGAPPPLSVDICTETIEIRCFVDCDAKISEMAVYSDDRPVQFWRKVPGFIEGDCV